MITAVLKRIKKEEKGFTLIELLAVIVILGIIAAIAVPMITGIISKSGKDSDLATARQINDAARLYISSELNGVVEDKEITLAQLVDMKYLSDDILRPSVKKPLFTDTTLVKYVDGELDGVTLVSDGASNKTYTRQEILGAVVEEE